MYLTRNWNLVCSTVGNLFCSFDLETEEVFFTDGLVQVIFTANPKFAMETNFLVVV